MSPTATDSVAAAATVTFPERVIGSQPHYGEVIKVNTPTHVNGIMKFANGAVGTLTVRSNGTLYCLDALSLGRFTNAVGQVYDSGAFAHMMERASKLSDWDGFAARKRAAKASVEESDGEENGDGERQPLGHGFLISMVATRRISRM